MDKFVVIERVKYIGRQGFGLKLLAIEEAKGLVQKFRHSYKKNQHNQHNQVNSLYLEVDSSLLKQRLGYQE